MIRITRKWWIFVSICLIFVVFSVTVCVAQGNYQYKWRLPQVHPVGSDYDLRAVAFADEVREKTEGRIDITVYSGSVLGDWVECYERVMRGDYEITVTPIAPTYDPRLNIAYYMPYLFTSTEKAKEAYKQGGWVFSMVEDLLLDQGQTFYPLV